MGIDLPLNFTLQPEHVWGVGVATTGPGLSTRAVGAWNAMTSTEFEALAEQGNDDGPVDGNERVVEVEADGTDKSSVPGCEEE